MTGTDIDFLKMYHFSYWAEHKCFFPAQKPGTNHLSRVKLVISQEQMFFCRAKMFLPGKNHFCRGTFGVQAFFPRHMRSTWFFPETYAEQNGFPRDIGRARGFFSRHILATWVFPEYEAFCRGTFRVQRFLSSSLPSTIVFSEVGSELNFFFRGICRVEVKGRCICRDMFSLMPGERSYHTSGTDVG